MVFAAERLAQAQMTATLTTVLATVPSSRKWIVSEIDIVNTDTVTRALTLSMPGSTAAALLFDALDIGPGETVQWTGHKVLNAGETICGGADVSGKVGVTIDGAQS